jgi:signal transduction histidine kinase
MSEPEPFDKIALLKLAFNGLAEDELREMADLTELYTYPPGYVLCQEGRFEEIFYILAEGNAVISKQVGEQDGERTLRLAGKGDLIGEMALIQNAPRSATVRATTEVTVLEMEKSDFETMLSRSPRMALDLIRITLDRMRENDQAAIKELQTTNKVLRQLDRNKLEFIQVAAHELRTPLTVLKGYANVLRTFPELQGDEGPLNDVLSGILNGADRMHEVVNTMLDVTRIDTETLQLHLAPVLLKRIITDVLRDFEKAASDRRLKLAFEPEGEIPNVNGDPSLIQKAMNHLIVNAIKYTPDGGSITVRTRPVMTEKRGPGIEISVADTGIGLDAEHQELIFEKFYQVGDVSIHSSGKTTYKGGGPGLGLAIVRGVARAHGGRVWVKSSGHDETAFPGSTFYLELPLDPRNASPSPFTPKL